MKKIIKEIKYEHKDKATDFNILRKLKHPCIPEVNDAFEHKGAMYVILQYFEGGNLRELLKSEGPAGEDRALQITLDILCALSYLHSMKPKPLIHGDIKPENIMLSVEHAVLIDFGSADSEEASSGFCAPERFAGIKKSKASDIYSVGEILHYISSGKVKKIYDNKNSLGISNDIYKIIEKSTRKSPTERYSCPEEMSSDVKRLLDLRKAGLKKNSDICTVCFPGSPESACESAYAVSKMKKNVLIADLNMLEPRADMICGVNKHDYSLQDFMSDDPSELKNRCVRIKKSSLYLLPCRPDYEGYETAKENIIPRLIASASGFFDVVFLLCCDFPYDRYFMDSLYISDTVIFPISKGIPDIRKYNSMVRFITNRQNISREKIYFVGFDAYKSNISKSILAGTVDATWLGEIFYSKKRSQMYPLGNPYIFSMEKESLQRYKKIMKKAGVI